MRQNTSLSYFKNSFEGKSPEEKLSIFQAEMLQTKTNNPGKGLASNKRLLKLRFPNDSSHILSTTIRFLNSNGICIHTYFPGSWDSFIFSKRGKSKEDIIKDIRLEIKKTFEINGNKQIATFTRFLEIRFPEEIASSLLPWFSGKKIYSTCSYLFPLNIDRYLFNFHSVHKDYLPENIPSLENDQDITNLFPLDLPEIIKSFMLNSATWNVEHDHFLSDFSLFCQSWESDVLSPMIEPKIITNNRFFSLKENTLTKHLPQTDALKRPNPFGESDYEVGIYKKIVTQKDSSAVNHLQSNNTLFFKPHNVNQTKHHFELKNNP